MSGLKISRLETKDLKPKVSEIGVAELAVNLEDRKLYTKDHHGNVISVGGGSGSFITQNKNVLDKDFALKPGESGVTTSFELADGVTLTIPDGSTLSIV